MQRARDILRSGDWLIRERVRFVAIALLFSSVAGFLYLVVTSHGAVDLQGRPLGTDFSNVYTAGTLVHEGRTADAFDPALEYAREREIFGGGTPFYGWHYPPYFLFVAAALAWLPYGLSLAVWQGVTLVLYLLVIRAILEIPSPERGGMAREARQGLSLEPATPTRPVSPVDLPLSGGGIMRGGWLLLALAFPSVLINVGHGQNGFLTAALLGGALVVLDRRPLLAGILLGLLVYKPQYGLMLPVVLGVSGRWRAFAAAGATVIGLTVATTFAFGMPAWHAFTVFSEYTRTVVLEQGDTGWHKIQSVFSWARMWGAPISLAYAIQGIVTVAIGAALAWLWRGSAPFSLKAAALCLGTILATPYSFDYDMMVLAPAIAFFTVDGFARGFGPWEKTALAALWLVPLVARSVAQVSMIPLGVPAMAAVFFLILHRAGIGRALPAAWSGSTMPPNPGGTSRGGQVITS
jgi:alpha-1,2-mannosyltransferase